MIIGVSGTIGSGKDTAARYLASKGFQHFSLADILREEVTKIGKPLDRETMRVEANRMREEKGSGFLAELAIKRVTENNVVFSAVRTPGEVDFLKKQEDFFLLFVDADPKIRYERIVSRQRENEAILSFEEFLAKDELETNGKSSQVVSYCKEHADFVLDNSASRDELLKQIDVILQKLDGEVNDAV